MNNIICIDPSLSCTAVVVNDRKAVFTTTNTAMTKTMRYNKWFDLCDPYVDVHLHDFDKSKLSFAATEVSKLKSYDLITTNIISYIQAELLASGRDKNPSKVYIEGYSFSSAAGPLIDLVTFGTLLRSKLYYGISTDLTVITPSELKMYAAMLTYTPVMEGKKLTYRNGDGVSGGKFKKHEMFKALIENGQLNCEWLGLLREHASDILAAKSIPKPIEDINDAKLMYEIAKLDKYI